jgi:hypothetical protein
MTVLFVVIFFIFAFCGRVSATCPDPWVPGPNDANECFLFNDHSTPYSWYGCSDYCESYRGHMLCIEDADKQLFIETAMPGVGVWISYNDINYDADWTWPGKCKNHGYTDWANGNVGAPGLCGYLWFSFMWGGNCEDKTVIVCACQGQKSEGLLSSPVPTSDDDNNHTGNPPISSVFASLPIFFYFPIIIGGMIMLCIVYSIVSRFVCPGYRISPKSETRITSGKPLKVYKYAIFSAYENQYY